MLLRREATFAVLGVGSIGSIILSSLADTKARLVAVTRGEGLQTIRRDGLTIYSSQICKAPEASKKVPAARFDIVDSESGIPSTQLHACDAAIICGKADSTVALATLADDLLKEDGIAVSVQNGLGHADVLAAKLGRTRVLGAITTHAVWRGEDENSKCCYWAGRGIIRIGSLDGALPSVNAQMLINYLEEAGLSPQWDEQIMAQIWRKLLVNVGINPICAIYRRSNGEILERPELFEQSLAAMTEAARVAIAAGVNVDDLDLEKLLTEVAQTTAENRCSMLQDVLAGRRTEIEDICGAIVRIGREVGLQTPVNAGLLAQVQKIEKVKHLKSQPPVIIP